MKKLIMLAAMLALVMALAIPAIAQVNQTFTQSSTSGDVRMNGTVTSTGDNSNQCAPLQQFGNTGSQQNLQGVLQYSSESGGIGFAGSSFTNMPEQTVSCNLKVQQAASSSSGS